MSLTTSTEQAMPSMDSTSTLVQLLPISHLHKTNPLAAEGILWYYWRQLLHDQLVDSLFYDTKMRSFWDFLAFALDNNKIFYVVFRIDDPHPVGHFHLTHFEGLTARLHFSLLRQVHGPEALKIAKATLHLIFKEMRDEPQPRPLVQTLFGITPTSNRLAIRFLTRSGFKPLATIQNACFIHERNEYIPALLSMIEADADAN